MATSTGMVADITGVRAQNMQQDPNGPLLEDVMDTIVEAAQVVPFDYNLNLGNIDDLDRFLARLAEGRFIIRFGARTFDECREMLARIRKHYRE